MNRTKSDADIAADWWQDLQPYFQDGRRNPAGDRAALARLRRADLRVAMEDPATLALFRALGRTRPDDLPEVALCAAVLARVRENDRTARAARQLGAPPGDPDARGAVSPLRFRRLIEAGSPEERLAVLRRAVALADGRINVRDLAAACLDWTEQRRRTWIFEYYNAGSAAPEPQSRAEDTHA